MIKIVITLIALIPVVAVAGFVNPTEFDHSKAQTDEVKAYIKKRVKKDYCELRTDTCQTKTLIEMEKLEFEYFIKASKSKSNHQILAGVRTQLQVLPEVMLAGFRSVFGSKKATIHGPNPDCAKSIKLN